MYHEIRNQKSEIRNPQSGGFSLVELLVAVGIIAILSVSSVVGFGYLSDILKAREVTGYIGDVINQEEMKILRGDFDKATVYFLSDYLVVEEESEEASLGLNLDITSGSSCAGTGHKLNIGNDGSLTQKDEDGAILGIKNVKTGSSDCLPFRDSEETGWNYQLADNGESSKVVRFIHFNLLRENLPLANPILLENHKLDPNSPENPPLSSGGVIKIKIESPYGKKFYYYDDDLSDLVQVVAKDRNGNSEDSLTFP